MFGQKAREEMEAYRRTGPVYCPRCERYGTEGRDCLPGPRDRSEPPRCINCGAQVRYVGRCYLCDREVLSDREAQTELLCEMHGRQVDDFWKRYESESLIARLSADRPRPERPASGRVR